MVDNYFKHYGLPVSFFIDTGELKRLYYQKSKTYHPDFHTLKDESQQEEMLSMSSFNNRAYHTLKDFRRRVFHILELEGKIKEEGDNKLPQSFLMDMMEVNEKIMELEMSYDSKEHAMILKEVDEIEESALEEITPLMKKFDAGEKTDDILNNIRDFYFKQKYLWRIKENLDKFADH